jgi:phenylpropionate dioxygenase-like ring-hydroxylating dioxygenase large terminal subunit
MTKTTDPVALREWTVIGRDADTLPGTTMRTRLLGQAITCTRDIDGTLHAQETDAHGAPAATVNVRERYGHVWATFSDTPRPMIEIPEFDDPARRRLLWGGVMVRTCPQRLIENFLDMGHFAYVHTDLLGSEPHTEIETYKVETRQDVAEIWATECRVYQPKASKAAAEGRDVEYIYRTSGPFVVVLYKTAEQPGTFDNMGMLVQPMDEDHCRVFGYTLLLEQESPLVDALHFQQTIFLQDRLILEQQMPRKIPLHDTSEIPTRADAAAMAYRRWLREVGMQFGIQPKVLKPAAVAT